MSRTTASRSRAPLALILLALAGCASLPPEATAPPRTQASQADAARAEVAALARELIGTPYRYGGADPAHGFDCSGLVYWSYRHAGLDVPRTAQAQFKAAQKIPLRQATAGDLVFFQDQEQLSHVGIYLGQGLFVHAPSSGETVAVASLAAPYYQEHLIAVGRLIEP